MGMKRLQGRRALVTGASRGIGAAIARRLAAEGAKVVVNFVSSQAAAEAVVSAIRDEGGEATAICADMSKIVEIERLVAEAAAWLGGLDILVNNAGVLSNGGPFGTHSEEVFDRVMDTNVKGPWFATQAAAPLLTERVGAVVNIGSLGSFQPGAGSIYNVSKAAIVTMTASLARFFGPRGIRVNAVAPGFVETDMLTNVNPDFLARYLPQVPAGRIGRAEEIAAVVAFLASDDASYVNGETLPVGGGVR